MKESNSKHRAFTIQEMQKQIYTFLTTKNKSHLALPSFVSHDAPFKATITIKYILPLISQTQIETKPKELIITLLLDVLNNSQRTLQQIQSLFNNSQDQSQVLSQIASQIKNQTTLTNILSKLISLPTVIINLINDPKINVPISIKEIESHKRTLYFNILMALKELQQEQSLMIINKLLILKEEATVAQYFLKYHQEEFLIDHFDSLSKQNNLIKYLYIVSLSQTSSQLGHQSRGVLKSLANRCKTMTACVMSLLNLNEIDYYSGQKYKHFYGLFYETKLKSDIIKELLLWWAVSKNFIITKPLTKVRCNILAMMIENISKEELLANGYFVSISEGIKKRLTDGQSRQYARLIWKILGKKLDLKLSQDIEKSEYFEIVTENTDKLGSSQSSMCQGNGKQSHNSPDKIINTHQAQAVQPEHEKQQQMENISQIDDLNQSTNIIKIEPKNIYDCILGLRNPHRKQMALKKLPSIIKKYKDDLILMWNTLLRELLSTIKQQYIPILSELFTMKPEEFIESVVMFFMNRQNSIAQKTYLMDILKIGIDELSSIQDDQAQQQDQGFYFKKVKSKYFQQIQQSKNNEKELQKSDQRTRRWGHTRIAYQNSKKGSINLKFIKKQTAINHFYPIANLLYFKIIDVLTLNLIDNLRSHQIYVHSLLKLLAVFISNIKNHFDKYIVVADASRHCAQIVQQLIDNSKRNNDKYEETGGQTLMLTLQVLNKISLIIDQYVTENIISNLKQAIQGSRKLPNYGMSSVLEMIQANIYQRVYMKSFQPEY